MDDLYYKPIFDDRIRKRCAGFWCWMIDQARAKQDYERSDILRGQLKEQGIIVSTKDGKTTWTMI